MAEQINANESKSLDNGVSSLSLPSLPESLNSFYNSLDAFNKGVFVRLFRYLWGVVNWKSINRGQYVGSFWLLYGQMVRADLPPYTFALLSYIYYMTDQGAKTIHSDNIYYSGVLPGYKVHSIRVILSRLARSGYLVRSTKDPGQPYSQRAQHNKQPVYVRLSPAGLRVIEDMTKQINKILLNTSLNDLTGVSNKKP